MIYRASGTEEMMKSMQHKYKYKWKRACSLVLATAVLGNCGSFPGGGHATAYAAEAVSAPTPQTVQSGTVTEFPGNPDTETPLGSYTEVQMLCFGDNVLEYWEIQGLVEHYNPTYLKQLEIFNGNPDGSSGLSKDQLLLMAEEFRFEAKELKEEAEERKDSISEEAYLEYQDNIKTLKRFAKEKEEAADGTPTTKRALRIVRNQQTNAVSAQMREYQTLLAQNEIAQKSLELAELSYASSERQYALGMISGEELLAAQDSFNAAKASADVSAAALLKGKQSLLTALGWNYDGNPDIRTIPDPDLTKAAAYNLGTDMELAVGANYDVGDIRRTDKSEFNGTQDKLRQIKEKEDEVRMQMEFLYKDVQQKVVSYQSAAEGWPVSEAKLAQADRKFALGMISKAEYLAEEIAWLTAKASKEQAALNLQAAMETYEWAVKGLIE